MRDRHICPKCDHREIIRFPELEANKAPVCVATRMGTWRVGGVGRLEAFVCAKCSYTELYMLDIETAKREVEGAEVLQGPPLAAPFR